MQLLETDPALGIYFLKLLRSPDSPDAQRRIFQKYISKFTNDVRRIDFGMDLATMVGEES